MAAAVGDGADGAQTADIALVTALGRRVKDHHRAVAEHLAGQSDEGVRFTELDAAGVDSRFAAEALAATTAAANA